MFKNFRAWGQHNLVVRFLVLFFVGSIGSGLFVFGLTGRWDFFDLSWHSQNLLQDLVQFYLGSWVLLVLFGFKGQKSDGS